MNFDEFLSSMSDDRPSLKLSKTLTSLWWDKKGDWNMAHSMLRISPVFKEAQYTPIYIEKRGFYGMPITGTPEQGGNDQAYQYQTFRGNPSDDSMLSDVLSTHQNQYKRAPWNLSADRRFFSEENQKNADEAGVKKVSICKPGYRSEVRKQIEKEPWFKKLQRFRAGIEGLISVLMRAYGLKRCNWKGWEAFESYVGLSVVTYNLQKIASLL